MNCSKDSLPLRQTCNRCRELKVRCQSRQSSIPSSTSQKHPLGAKACLRCLRAGADCTFSSKERSGRPPVSRLATLPTSPAVSPPPMPSSAENYFLEEPSPPSSWSNSWSNDLDFTGFADESQNLAVETNALEGQSFSGVPRDIMTSSLIWPAMALDSQSSKDTDTPPCQQQQCLGEVDRTSTDMNELTELNSRIYNLQLQFGTGFLLPRLCDDMTDSTRALLAVLERTVDYSRSVGPQDDHQTTPPTYSVGNPPTSELLSPRKSQEKDTPFRRRTIESSIYPDETSRPVCGVTDTSTFFLILSCYHRLFSLFKQVCLSIHMELVDNRDLQSSTAQIVMTIELVSHLLGRLERGLQQIFSTGTPTPPCSGIASFPRESILTAPSAYDVNTNLSGIWPLAKSRSAVVCEDLFSNGACIDTHSIMRAERANCVSHQSWSHGVSSIIHTMLQRQRSLKTHVCILKQLVQESNRF